MNSFNLNPKTRIGHIHLTVSDMDASLKFYRDILGFEITQSLHGAVFLSIGSYHHIIGLNTWSSKNPSSPKPGQIGLYHFAILYPGKKELAMAIKRLLKFNYPISGSSDHGVSQSIYLYDPDGNGIEIYYDKNRKDWPKDKNGKILMGTEYLDLKNLLKFAD